MTTGFSLSTELMGTPLYEMAVELAEQFTDDFQKQEEFIEGVLKAYILVTNAD